MWKKKPGIVNAKCAEGPFESHRRKRDARENRKVRSKGKGPLGTQGEKKQS